MSIPDAGASSRSSKESPRLGPGNGSDAGWKDHDVLFIPMWPHAYFRKLQQTEPDRVLAEYDAFCKRRDKVIEMKHQLSSSTTKA